MDYTSLSLSFRIKKTWRYVKLYGISRTIMKVKGQYHMRKVYNGLPVYPLARRHDGLIGIIGCGNYAFSNIAYYVDKYRKGRIRACMDTDINKAASLYEEYGLCYYTDDVGRILSDSHIKLVFIASNHASHAEYAIDCIRAGKHVHIEKPHVVSRDQLERLISAMREYPDAKVYLGFNRPRSDIFVALQGYLAGQSGPLMINWFVAGHEIPDDHWYFDKAEGGRVLGNLCHWTDLTIQLVSLKKAFPCTIVPATPENAKSDFVVSIMFADRSCASITFSAKGHTFEGVREVLNLHKGDILANLTDFQSLSIDDVEKKHRMSIYHRDHGHQANILNSLQCLTRVESAGENIDYVRATGLFFLAIREAIDSGESITFTP